MGRQKGREEWKDTKKEKHLAAEKRRKWRWRLGKQNGGAGPKKKVLKGKQPSVKKSPYEKEKNERTEGTNSERVNELNGGRRKYSSAGGRVHDIDSRTRGRGNKGGMVGRRKRRSTNRKKRRYHEGARGWEKKKEHTRSGRTKRNRRSANQKQGQTQRPCETRRAS